MAARKKQSNQTKQTPDLDHSDEGLKTPIPDEERWNNVADHFKALLDEYESDDSVTFMEENFEAIWEDQYLGKRRISPITL